MERIEFEDAVVVEPAKVSVLDELPVGSVIDYEGDTVPEGFEEVEEIKLIESGSVSGIGYYNKFSDGTIFCYGITNSVGFSNTGIKDGTIDLSGFGLKSIQNAQLTLMVNYSDYGNGKFHLHMKDRSTNAITFSIRNEYPSTIGFYVNWFAIGKWK